MKKFKTGDHIKEGDFSAAIEGVILQHGKSNEQFVIGVTKGFGWEGRAETNLCLDKKYPKYETFWYVNITEMILIKPIKPPTLKSLLKAREENEIQNR